jgi:hypothetical protein
MDALVLIFIKLTSVGFFAFLEVRMSKPDKKNVGERMEQLPAEHAPSEDIREIRHELGWTQFESGRRFDQTVHADEAHDWL